MAKEADDDEWVVVAASDEKQRQTTAAAEPAAAAAAAADAKTKASETAARQEGWVGPGHYHRRTKVKLRLIGYGQNMDDFKFTLPKSKNQRRRETQQSEAARKAVRGRRRGGKQHSR